MTKNNIIPPKSRALIERDANALAKKYQPETLEGRKPFDIEDFAEFELEKYSGVSFSVTEELPFGVLGLTDPIQSQLWMPQSLAENRSEQGIRYYRSTLAHEVGHCLYHVGPIRQAGKKLIFSQREDQTVFYRATPGGKAYLDPEWQAWEFAGALLMPKSIVIKMLLEGASMYDMAEYFDLNGAFVESRLRKLRLKN